VPRTRMRLPRPASTDDAGRRRFPRAVSNRPRQCPSVSSSRTSTTEGRPDDARLLAPVRARFIRSHSRASRVPLRPSLSREPPSSAADGWADWARSSLHRSRTAHATRRISKQNAAHPSSALPFESPWGRSLRSVGALLQNSATAAATYAGAFYGVLAALPSSRADSDPRRSVGGGRANRGS
jgi:hypothetical protein